MKTPTRLLYIGIGFIALFCIIQTIWFWREASLYNAIVGSGGMFDPTEINAKVRQVMWARYLSNISLGIGLTCVALSLFQVFRRVVMLLEK